MKLSELIAELGTAYLERGDLECRVQGFTDSTLWCLGSIKFGTDDDGTGPTEAVIILDARS